LSFNFEFTIISASVMKRPYSFAFDLIGD